MFHSPSLSSYNSPFISSDKKLERKEILRIQPAVKERLQSDGQRTGSERIDYNLFAHDDSRVYRSQYPSGPSSDVPDCSWRQTRRNTARRSPRGASHRARAAFVLDSSRGRRMRSPRWRLGSHSPVGKALSKLRHIKKLGNISRVYSGRSGGRFSFPSGQYLSFLLVNSIKVTSTGRARVIPTVSGNELWVTEKTRVPLTFANHIEQGIWRSFVCQTEVCRLKGMQSDMFIVGLFTAERLTLR